MIMIIMIMIIMIMIIMIMIKVTWQQGELCDKRTFPLCTQLSSQCARSPCICIQLCICVIFFVYVLYLNLCCICICGIFVFQCYRNTSPWKTGKVMKDFSFCLTMYITHLKITLIMLISVDEVDDEDTHTQHWPQWEWPSRQQYLTDCRCLSCSESGQ